MFDLCRDKMLTLDLFSNNSRLRYWKYIKVLFSESICDQFIGACLNTIYTNFKFEPCLSFDLEFPELLKGAIVAFVRI